MSNEELTLLRGFLGAYFHEDWSLDHASADEVVQTFILDNKDGRMDFNRLADLLEGFAERAENGKAVECALFRDFWCYYVPSAEGLDARWWLRHLGGLMRGARTPKGS